MKRRVVLGSLGSLGALALPAWGQFRVEISGVGATQMPVAIAEFRDEQKTGVAAIVRADLERSGQFKLIEAGSTPVTELSSPAFADWRTAQADALVGGSVTRLADGRLDVRFRLWDVVTGKDLGGESQVVVAEDIRLAAHRVADAIYQKLTGERGVFSTRLAYVTKAGRQYALRIADADGEGGQVAVTSPEPIISPAWAPDGRTVAYVSFHTGKPVVYLQDLATGSRLVLADFRGSNSAPAFSPDGRRVVVSLSREGGTQLFVINRDGSGLKRLAQSLAIDTEATFSADGSKIYFVSDRGGGPQIYRMPSEGGSAERVTFNSPYSVSPTLSPDGKSMAFVSRLDGAFKVCVMDLSNGGAVRVISDTVEDESPSFAPNGKLLVYATRSQGKDVLMTSTLDGRVKAKLVVTSADVREPAWGPFTR
ncbi:Tol-Pal system beta propeller repeat protein TolB [Inhella gelatinilytica]|uniref:Tol-Pal system protein TolB n=1 Tax=Inhella gelatinilytica TaxID=2795030 RepID=A0A931NAL0_9BURK|nr:Tol-Pal system beta propeller repeat protein TolB [Inhella gelatinilytica]MBH9552588.1 Tol-Pal system protein TolB [Inhella gelatinilytica]